MKLCLLALLFTACASTSAPVPTDAANTVTDICPLLDGHECPVGFECYSGRCNADADIEACTCGLINGNPECTYYCYEIVLVSDAGSD